MPKKRIGVRGYDRTKGGRRESVRPHTRSITIRLEKPFYQTLSRYAKSRGYRDVPAFLETFLPEYGRDEWEPELEMMEGTQEYIVSGNRHYADLSTGIFGTLDVRVSARSPEEAREKAIRDPGTRHYAQETFEPTSVRKVGGSMYPVTEGGAAVTNDEGVTFRVGDRITPTQRLTMPGDPTGEDDLMPGDTLIVSEIRSDGMIGLEGIDAAWNDWEPNWFRKAGA